MPLTKRMKAAHAVKPADETPLPVLEAVEVLKKFPPTKFDQTVEIHVRLGIDPKQADQIVRGSIVLPHGIGKSKRVVVFAKGNMAEDAKAAGARKLVQRNWPRRSRVAGPTSTSALLRLT